MDNLASTQHAPAPDGTLEHDARSASQRTRLGAGAVGIRDNDHRHERGEQAQSHTLHDAMVERGILVPSAQLIKRTPSRWNSCAP